MIRMKKLMYALVACTLLLSGCAGAEEGRQAQGLAAREPGDEMRDFEDLLGVDVHAGLYDYQVEESCRTLEIWLSEYDGRQGIEQERMRFVSRIEEPSGTIGFAIESGAGGADTWRMLHVNGASRSTYEGDMDAKEDPFTSSAQSGPPEEDRSIVLEEPMALHVIVRGEDGVSIYNLEEYDRDPKRALEAESTVVLWCRFSSKTMGENG